MSIEHLISDLKEKEKFKEYWDFRRNDQRPHVHSMIKYPAVMVPNMQGEIFDLILKNDPEIQNVLDPFMGSGTILIEGLSRGLNAIGIDINPLSYLAVLVKTQKYAKKLLSDKSQDLFNRIISAKKSKKSKYELHCFDGIDKWYLPSVIHDLSILRACILLESDIKYRRFFWLAFAEIAKQADNARSSTFKLHIKLETSINETDYNCIESFVNKVKANITAVLTYKDMCTGESTKLYYGDSRKILNDKRRFKDNSIDLVMTSPPYGDNATTITYGQYSVLPLRWIPLTDINDKINQDTINSLCKIDKNSLGGINYDIDFLNDCGILESSPALNNFVNLILSDTTLTDKAKKEKMRKVSSFILDFDKVLEYLNPVVKKSKLLVFTVGNRHVNRTEFPLHIMLQELAQRYDMTMLYDFRRNIIKNKNYVDTSTQGFKTINKETILILQKQ
jgi:site-specific DNA-methyltransferase (cytosine-N4-specific)